jgi:peptide/nickel transport system permease protein
VRATDRLAAGVRATERDHPRTTYRKVSIKLVVRGHQTPMPSSSLDDAGFTDIDWAAESGGRSLLDAPTLGLLAGLLAVAGLLAYDLRAGTPFGALNWDPTRMDWLALASAVLFGRYGCYPLIRDRDRAASALRSLLARPAGAFSLVVVVGSLLFALVAPELVSFGYPRLEHRLQPPVYARVHVADVYAYSCVGELSNGYCHGTWRYPLGTDRYGESVTELLFNGNRVAVKLGLTTAAIMGVVATTVGTTAGYVGGLVDDALMGYVDVQQTIPAVVVYIVLATLFLGEIGGVSDGGLFALALVFGLLDWGGIARLVRSDVLTRRSAGYVRAARAAGASDLHVIRRHVVPNSTGTVVTALTRRVPLLVLAQVALAYLELNRAGSLSLGRTLRLALSSRVQNLPWYETWWLSVFALAFLVVFVLAYSLFGDELRDVLDPNEGAV